MQNNLMPGQATAAHAMPLAEFIGEVLALLERNPMADEVLVERVKLLHHAEGQGSYEQVFQMINGMRR